MISCGAEERCRHNFVKIMVILLALGFKLAWHKAQYGKRVTWTSFRFQVIPTGLQVLIKDEIIEDLDQVDRRGGGMLREINHLGFCGETRRRFVCEAAGAGLWVGDIVPEGACRCPAPGAASSHGPGPAPAVGQEAQRQGWEGGEGQGRRQEG